MLVPYQRSTSINATMQCFIFHIVLILVALDFVRAFIATEPVAEKIRAGDIKEKLGESNHGKKMVRGDIFNKHLCST